MTPQTTEGASVHPALPLLPQASPFVVLGAPGSGKTTLLVDYVDDLVTHHNVHPDQVRILTPTRAQASALRDHVGVRLQRSTRGPMVVSVASFAFELVRIDAELRGTPAPRLRSGADVDQDILDLLSELDSSATGPQWPEHLGPHVRGTEAFRTELRELIARCVEHGVTPENLRSWAEVHPAWPAVADFVEHYQRIIARSRPHEYDSAELLRLATSIVQSGTTPLRGLRAVLVDNVHDVSPASTDLLLALHHQGIVVGVSADPDVAGQTFRGADPEAPARLAQALKLEPIVLEDVVRHGPTIRTVVGSVTARVGTALSGSQRRAQSVAVDGDAPALAVVSPSPGREAHDIARLLRQAHRERNVAYRDMAVVVRRAGAIPLLVSALNQESIPTHTDYRVPLAHHPSVRELIGWIRVARTPDQVDHAEAASLLTGVFGGLSRRQLRRLGFTLRALDYQQGESASTSDSVLALVRGGTLPLGLPESWHQPLERVLGVVQALRELPDSTTADLLASAAWTRWKVEDDWVARATHPQHPSPFARESLTQIAALLRTAERYVASHPGVGAMAFFDSVLRAEVAEDVVMPELQRQGVTITTPSSVAGEEFRIVVLAGVNDHVWPNTRIRGSLLGAPLVSRALRGQLAEPVDEQRVVIDDELRMAALALSRATDQVVVTAVSSEDQQPSALFHLIAEHCELLESSADHSGTSRSLVSSYRVALLAGDESAAESLAYLHHSGVPGAHPERWWGLRDQSSTTPLFEGESVPVSPSKIASVENSPVDWFLDRIAPDDLPPTVGVGSLLHYALEHAAEGTKEELAQLVSTRFSELDFESAWQAASHHRRALNYVLALADYLAERRASGSEVVRNEARFQIELDGAVVVGVIDRVECQADGSFVVVDLKTGKPVSDNHVVDDPQLSAYQLALNEGELATELGSSGHVAGAWLLFVREGKDGKRFRVAAQEHLTADALAQFRQRVGEAARTMAASEFEGPVSLSFGGNMVPAHRWQRIPAVCGD